MMNMPAMNSINNPDLDRLIEEGRKRGYVRRAELEAALQRMPKVSEAAPMSTHQPGDDESAPAIEELTDLDAAVEQLLAADVDIVDDEEEEAQVRDDEAIESGIHAMETDSLPLVD